MMYLTLRKCGRRGWRATLVMGETRWMAILPSRRAAFNAAMTEARRQAEGA